MADATRALRFSEAEYLTMIVELLDGGRHDMLCTIVEKTLRSYVSRKCFGDGVLRGKEHEEDLMQELKLHFIQTVVDDFLFKDERKEPNMDMQYFNNWLYRVASNYIQRYRSKEYSFTHPEEKQQYSEGVAGRISDFGNIVPLPRIWGSAEENDRLQTAFEIAWGYRYSVHKTLTWLAQFVLMLSFGLEPIPAKHMIADKLSERTLSDIYTLTVAETKYVPWLKLDADRTENVRSKLNADGTDGRVGETVYGTLFMKKGPLASVSDWINRITEYVLAEYAKTV